jgi:hypothetical protein
MNTHEEVGETTKNYWLQIVEQGFLNDFPEASFEIIKESKFPEFTLGKVNVRKEDKQRFMKIKREMTKNNGGRWIIW